MNSADPKKAKGSSKWQRVYVGILAAELGLGIYFFILLFSAPCSSGKLSQVDADMRSIDSALTTYKLVSGSFPTTGQGLDVLVEKSSAAPALHRGTLIAKKLPRDPWGSPYDYRFPGRNDPTRPEIISRGRDGVANTADDLSSQDE